MFISSLLLSVNTSVNGCLHFKVGTYFYKKVSLGCFFVSFFVLVFFVFVLLLLLLLLLFCGGVVCILCGLF